MSPLDHGLVVGDGVFETLRVVPTACRSRGRGTSRGLQASADGLGLDAPDPAELRAAADAVLAANALDRGAAAHHRHRRARAARIAARAGAADRDRRRRSELEPAAPTRRRR